jgi:hypothetical protein
MRPMAAFSFSQWTIMPPRCSTRSASSASRASSRSWLAESVSLASATFSISSWRTRRSTTSISVGRLSISMRSLEAASSTRSMALSGRNRPVRYRSESTAAATSAASWMRTPWWTS